MLATMIFHGVFMKYHSVLRPGPGYSARRRPRSGLWQDREVRYRPGFYQPGPREAQAWDLGAVHGRGEGDPRQGHRGAQQVRRNSHQELPVQGDRAEDPRRSAQQMTTTNTKRISRPRFEESALNHIEETGDILCAHIQ